MNAWKRKSLAVQVETSLMSTGMYSPRIQPLASLTRILCQVIPLLNCRLNLRGCLDHSVHSNVGLTPSFPRSWHVAQCHIDVLVLGAGISGITVAHTLKKAGLKVKILESRNVAGGRVRTDYERFCFPKSAPSNLAGKKIPVELGGSWIHGVGGGNPVYTAAVLAKAPLVKSQWERTAVYDCAGKRLPQSVVMWWLRVMSDMTEFFEEELDDPTVSISEALSDYLEINGLGKRDLASRGPDEGEGGPESEVVTISKELQQQLSRMALVIAGEWEWAERMEALSARNAFQDGERYGADVLMPEGYWTIFDKVFMPDLKSDIVYNAEVTKVVQNSAKNKVFVTTLDGAEYSADRVVCTLPLGILKRDSIKFSPALSDHKSVSMARVGYGSMNKIFLQFETSFWDPADMPTPHVLLWLNEKADGRLSIAMNHNAIVPHSNILCVMATGEAGLAIEELSDDQIIAEIMSVLKKVYGANIPQPSNTLITRWSKDKWSYGSYSSLVLGASHDDLKELARPEGHLFFAGEHTGQEYQGSVHGAYFTGIRAATEVLAAFGKPAPAPHQVFEPGEDLREE